MATNKNGIERKWIKCACGTHVLHLPPQPQRCPESVPSRSEAGLVSRYYHVEVKLSAVLGIFYDLEPVADRAISKHLNFCKLLRIH